MSVGKLKSWKVGLSGNARVTEEQLRDGRKYEDWLKDKVDRKKTDGNEGTRSGEEGVRTIFRIVDTGLEECTI